VAHLAVLEHDAQFAFARSAIIADGSDIFQTLPRQSLNQIVRKARAAKPAKHDARAITDISYRLVQGIYYFLGHPKLDKKNSEMMWPIDCSQPAAIVQPRCGVTAAQLRFSYSAENHLQKYLLDLFGVRTVIGVIPAVQPIAHA